jgi:nitroreductase
LKVEKFEMNKMGIRILFFTLSSILTFLKMIEILRTRRSIRKYAEQPIEPEKIEILKEAVLRSPSSKGINPWQFVFIDDKQTIQKLKECKPHGAAPLATATLAVAICADETVNDAWIEDCSIASILLQLTAQTLGLGSCWIHIRNRNYSDAISSEKYVQDILDIPPHFRVLSIISIGYPAQQREGKKFEDLQFEKIKINKF